jgi:parallel beta-helix repeat protein
LLVQTENSIIRGNNITNNRCSVYLLFSSNNTVSENSIINSGSGIYLSDSSNNTIYGNNVANNYFGVDLSYRYVPSINNTIYHNNFVNNTEQVYISTHPSYANFWDNGVEGNYWSNYTGIDVYSGPDQDLPGSNGIGDTPYDIDENNRDCYPLMAPFNTFDAGTWNGTAYNIDVISNSTVSNFQLDASQKTISFNVTGSEFTTGFCRVTIPNLIVQELWQGNFTVVLNGKPWPFRNWTDTGNTYIYINYTHSEHQIIIIPEFPSAIVFPLFMIFTLVAFVLRKKRGMGHHKRGG